MLATELTAAKPGKPDLKELKREGGVEALAGKPNKRDDKPDTGGGRVEAGDAQSRIMAKLREQLEVTDDAEWAVIAERITRVGELRRNLGGAATGRAAAALSDKKKPAGRDSSLPTEQAALRAALRDKLPDAEIKARLARVHEVYQQNESRLAQAQTELRAVLTVRQEAVAVMTGLLTP